MKKSVAVLLLSTATLLSAHAAVISQWTFEVNTPADLANSATISGISAEVGNGSASGVHASSATDWTTPAGNGSANALSANTWAVGDYFQFALNTLGFQSITVGWDQISSGTGPANFGLSWSTDGINFSQFGGNYTVLNTTSPSPDAWSGSGSPKTGSHYDRDLSSILDLENATAVYLRLIDETTTSASGGTVGTSGTDRIDNFTVSGTSIPQNVPDHLPFGFAAMTLLGVCLFPLRSFRRKAVQLK